MKIADINATINGIEAPWKNGPITQIIRVARIKSETVATVLLDILRIAKSPII